MEALTKQQGNPMRFDELEPSWQYRIRTLRTEGARYRVERNQARAELSAVKTELAELRAQRSGQ